MAICAVLCGADNWVEVADWCKDRRQWLKERFGLRLDRGTPSHDTFGDVFGVLDASVFEALSAVDQRTGGGGRRRGGDRWEDLARLGQQRQQCAAAHGDGPRGAKRPVPGAGRHLRQGARVDGGSSRCSIF
ncbi:MAG: transposase family protein [Sterolibacteriaceae bacterium]|nr:transposase family protein [Sterolibacteriaceae bacterium]